MSRRATSKWLCFIASMPRSKSTTSGCLESIFARGLVTFLLVQAVVIARIATRAMMGNLDDIKTSVFRLNPGFKGFKVSPHFETLKDWNFKNVTLDFQKRRVERRLQ